MIGESMVRQAHHDNCHPEPVEGWVKPDNDDFIRYLLAGVIIIHTLHGKTNNNKVRLQSAISCAD
jgi:hypothetical protein